jgi:uncharacterized lipoprotein YddW (UPF0748 family)
MRGVWLTNTDSSILHSRESLQRGLEQLLVWGFDTVYPAVWHRGHTLYPSPIGEKYTTHWTLPHPSYANRDYLAELIEIAHRLGIKVVAWWEYGLMLPPDSTLAKRYPGALTFTNTGTTQRRKAASAQLDPNIWFNPCDPFVSEMMSELLVDLVQRYDIDGIQFDDHWAWPVELGFDPATQAFYRQSISGIWPMRRRCNWADWASQQVTNCFRRVVLDMKAVRSNLLISIAPNPLRFSMNNYRMNWDQWLDMVDEVVLQVYRYDLPGFRAELAKPELQEIKHKTAIGILTGLKGKAQPAELIQQQILDLETSGFQGFSCFFYETAIDPKIIEVIRKKVNMVY